MILLIDNYDSFTYNLTDYFAQLGEDTMVYKNDAIDAHSISELQFDRIVVSPGPNTPSESGNLMVILKKVYKEYPILGICLGHQALGELFGAELTHAAKPMHGKVSELIHDGNGIYKGLPPRFKVCRYHSLLLKSIPTETLHETAQTEEGECMSFIHNAYPITGIQYHPEAILTEYGMDVLRNWLELTKPVVS